MQTTDPHDVSSRPASQVEAPSPVSNERLPRGAAVMTTWPNMSLRKEWTTEGWERRKWQVHGVVIDEHDSHGLCYDIRHEDGSIACYDPSEIEVLPA